MTGCVLLSTKEFSEREEARCAAINAWPGYSDLKGMWPPELMALNDTFFPVGSMWFMPWYDPADPEDAQHHDAYLAKATADPSRGGNHLSVHYWRDWAKVRPPLNVVCPGGGHWCVDQVSSNGTGWTVTGEAPMITASPSIWSGQGKGAPREYHGWLNAGVFSAPV